MKIIMIIAVYMLEIIMIIKEVLLQNQFSFQFNHNFSLIKAIPCLKM